MDTNEHEFFMRCGDVVAGKGRLFGGWRFGLTQRRGERGGDAELGLRRPKDWIMEWSNEQWQRTLFSFSSSPRPCPHNVRIVSAGCENHVSSEPRSLGILPRIPPFKIKSSSSAFPLRPPRLCVKSNRSNPPKSTPLDLPPHTHTPIQPADLVLQNQLQRSPDRLLFRQELC